MLVWITDRTPREGSYEYKFDIQSRYLTKGTVYVFKDKSSSLVWESAPNKWHHESIKNLVELVVQDELDVTGAELTFSPHWQL